MDAAELLHALAEKTVHAPEPPGVGPYHYQHTRGINLRTNRYLSRNGDSTTDVFLEKFEREQWIAADGSGRIVMTRGETAMAPPSGDYPPGHFAALFVTATDEESLSVELGRLSSKTTTRAVIKSLSQVWNVQVVTPSLQRLLLLHLAKRAGLTAEEGPREFAGRSGVAVSHLDDARHRRLFLVFSPDTGELIGTEEIALPGATVPVPVPGVVGRTEWLRTGREVLRPREVR